jgi:hypothetical protein
MSPTSYQTAPPRGGPVLIADRRLFSQVRRTASLRRRGVKTVALATPMDMNENIPIHPFPHDRVLEELADQLLECGAVLSQIVSRMVWWKAEGLSHPDAAPIPEVARSLVADALSDVKPKHSRRDLKVAAAIIAEATTAMSDNIFFVDPRQLKDADVDDAETG